MNGADRGKGRGPCTVHESLTPFSISFNSRAPVLCAEVFSSSKYADPDADGIRPVFKTTKKMSSVPIYSTIASIGFVAEPTDFPKLDGFPDAILFSDR